MKERAHPDPLDPSVLAREIEYVLINSGYNADVIEESVGSMPTQVRMLVQHPAHPDRSISLIIRPTTKPGA